MLSEILDTHQRDLQRFKCLVLAHLSLLKGLLESNSLVECVVSQAVEALRRVVPVLPRFESFKPGCPNVYRVEVGLRHLILW